MPSETPRFAPFSRLSSWYARWERPISSLSLIGGFVFDALTLTRVDLFWENLWVVGHLVIVGAAIVLVHVVEKKEEDAETNPARLHFWLVNILQFFFGGLFSTFLVYYYRSATLAVSWPFLVLLLAAFVANEALKRHYARITFQIALFYLALFSFSIFIVPVVIHQIGAWVFILSGVISLIAMALFLLILRFAAHERFVHSIWPIRFIVLGIFIGVNVLYFYNLIPPLPLSLKDSGIYESFVVNGPGEYTAGYENQGWFGFLRFADTVQIQADTPLYAYSAVFSPESLNTKIVHEWQYYNAQTKKWVTRGKISLAVVGGLDGGYRTFSLETNLTPGPWRVNVETPAGAIIGRMNFNVVIVTTTPALTTEQIN